jgi:hypothetical protein
MSIDKVSRLDTCILTYCLTIITSFLVLLMLLWHLSAAHLVDSYGMPDEWAEDFLEKQFAGWRGALWGLVFAAVSWNSAMVQ